MNKILFFSLLVIYIVNCASLKPMAKKFTKPFQRKLTRSKEIDIPQKALETKFITLSLSNQEKSLNLINPNYKSFSADSKTKLKLLYILLNLKANSTLIQIIQTIIEEYTKILSQYSLGEESFENELHNLTFIMLAVIELIDTEYSSGNIREKEYSYCYTLYKTTWQPIPVLYDR